MTLVSLDDCMEYLVGWSVLLQVDMLRIRLWITNTKNLDTLDPNICEIRYGFKCAECFAITLLPNNIVMMI